MNLIVKCYHYIIFSGFFDQYKVQNHKIQTLQNIAMLEKSLPSLMINYSIFTDPKW